MSEPVMSDTEIQLPPPPETGILLVDRTMAWVRSNYNQLVDLCEQNDLPKPPPW